jgi:eukaryotic-like serine/threonine-protein kinase
MGEVYRARDTRLRREVALKVLPPLFADDPERLARFEREAQMLAALNHPHIAHIYGLEEVPSAELSHPLRALVMELVEGEDLAQRLARGPIAVADALSIARQLADAIAAAHERAIIHRDLKPSNIRITADRTVKVLDFGIAKALQSDSGAPDSAPTVTGLSTALGGIIGTAAYMSPEQARGGSVDARGDVWAYGCVLYEMLTGRLAFSGATASDTIARILEREPDWEALPASTPPSLRRLLSRCLDKDPKRRLHAIADAQFDLDEALIASTLSSDARDTRTHRRTGRGGILLAAAVSTLVAVGLWKFLPRAGAMLPPRARWC